jgi:hypothetical protein
MAGNTKLMGFGAGGIVQLARWGKKANVAVGPEAVRALREAVYEKLPSAPPAKAGYTLIYYDAERGDVCFNVYPPEGNLLLKLLSLAEESKSFTAEEQATLSTWAGLLGAALAEREAHLDTQDEPGVDGDGLVE